MLSIINYRLYFAKNVTIFISIDFSFFRKFASMYDRRSQHTFIKSKTNSPRCYLFINSTFQVIKQVLNIRQKLPKIFNYLIFLFDHVRHDKIHLIKSKLPKFPHWFTNQVLTDLMPITDASARIWNQ